MKIIKKIWINKKYIAKKACLSLTTIYTVLGFIATLAPIDKFIPENLTLFQRISISILLLITVYIILFIIFAIQLCIQKQFTLINVKNGHKLYLQFGDIFSESIVSDSEKHWNILIPVNRCFDTNVDDELIASRSLHGQAIQKLIDSGKYTEEKLSLDVRKQLNMIKCNTTMLERKEKPKGNLKRYPVGTTVKIPYDEKVNYYLFALCCIDDTLCASISKLDYMIAIQNIIELCNSKSQEHPFVIPLIGGKFSRIHNSSAEILKFLIQSFKFNQNLINCDIHIVVYDDIKDEIPISSVIDSVK